VYIITAWQSISPEVTVKGFEKCCISSVVEGTDDDMLWNGSEEYGDVRSVRKTKAQTVKMERVTLTGKGR
jgi:hypothetical protein